MQDKFLWINFFFILLIIGSYLLVSRSPRRPSSLKLRRGVKNPPGTEKREEAAGPKKNREKPVAGKENPQAVRQLNVIFEFEGESYDACEVLDIPAGAGAGLAKEAFKQQMTTADSRRKRLLREALDALGSRS